ncbi:hypothetical protein SAMN04515667_0779 [Formosa sp. Hel1_31_208]|uniref:hypothetical protein n=1 Tax=Formosa sp. Hel1_31_208 TaxID=1798225 RepID=UPI00087B3542|nr:hypothetical protein [Formosa sp. Hel1_31_208]SDR82972.1 hypothetical protein SAMN04515667_0779 [Formosa sp. Hel1_31_208]
MTRQISTLILLLCYGALYSQEQEKTNGVFYKASVSATLINNEDYTLFNDNDESFIDVNGIFFNNTLGYQFDNRTSVGLNIEYAHYINQNLNFLPLYLDFTYNIFDFDDVVFVRGGYGKLVSLGKAFEDGTTYKVGFGYRAFDDNFKNSWLIGFDFSRKRYGFRQTEKLSSFSVFLEFMLF